MPSISGSFSGKFRWGVPGEYILYFPGYLTVEPTLTFFTDVSTVIDFSGTVDAQKVYTFFVPATTVINFSGTVLVTTNLVTFFGSGVNFSGTVTVGSGITFPATIAGADTNINSFITKQFDSTIAGNTNNINSTNTISFPASISTPPVTDPYFANVISLLHFDDAPGTTIPADVISGVTWLNDTPVRAVVSSTEKKFGTASLARPADPGGMIAGGLYRSFPNLIWTSTTPFTVEYWIYFTAFTQYGISGAVARHFCVNNNSSGIILNVSGQKLIGDGAISGTGTTTIALNTWYFVAMTSDGTTGRVFLNGNLEFTFTPVTLSNSPASLNVSPGRAVGYNGDYYTGYIDEFRLTLGICRYTANFATPTEPFPNS